MAQIIRQRHGPQAKHRMGAPARCRTGQWQLFFPRGVDQARDQIDWKKRRVRGKADHMRAKRALFARPFQRAENARQRSGIIFDHIRQHRQSRVRKPRRIAIGI